MDSRLAASTQPLAALRACGGGKSSGDVGTAFAVPLLRVVLPSRQVHLLAVPLNDHRSDMAAEVANPATKPVPPNSNGVPSAAETATGYDLAPGQPMLLSSFARHIARLGTPSL
jgi:hypothetical protein